jgi:hypothetical protein
MYTHHHNLIVIMTTMTIWREREKENAKKQPCLGRNIINLDLRCPD